MTSMSIRFGVTIARDPAQVFAFVADPRNLPHWDEQVSSARVSPEGPVGVGSQVLEVRRVMGRPMTFRAVVIEHEAPRRFAVEGRGAFPVLHRIVLAPARTGHTRLEVDAQATLRGPLRLLAPLMRAQAMRMFEASYDNLRRRLEQGAGSTPGAQPTVAAQTIPGPRTRVESPR